MDLVLGHLLKNLEVQVMDLVALLGEDEVGLVLVQGSVTSDICCLDLDVWQVCVDADLAIREQVSI